MTRMVIAFSVAAALLAACKKSSPPDCDGAGKAVEADIGDPAIGPGMAANIVLRCKEDKWSAAAADCVKNVKTGRLKDCEAKMTKDQADKLLVGIKALDSAAAAASTPPPPPTPAGPAPDCAAMEGVMTKAWNAQVATAKDAAARKAAEAMRVKARVDVAKHCTDDKWSGEATDCFKAVTNGDYAACKFKLSPMQVQAVVDMIPASAAPAAAGTQCSVIPEGNYEFKAGASIEELMAVQNPGTCSTAFENGSQVLVCEQAKPDVKLRAKLASGKKGVQLTSATLSGELEYSDAVVLSGALRDPGGKVVEVRLEFTDCKTEEECQAAFANKKRCH
jgi:hypothetical protein